MAQVGFDYSKYLAPKAWSAIRASQGVLYSAIPTFSNTVVGLTQAFVIDAKEGLLLSVAHGISEYPDVAMGKNTQYFFIYQDLVMTVEPTFMSNAHDLAIFKIRDGDLSKLSAVTFAQSVEPLGEYYSFSQRVTRSGANDFVIKNNIPWKARLVDQYEEVLTVNSGGTPIPIIIESMLFDTPSVSGFSGAGVFNSEGEVVGVIRGVLPPGGYSEVVSVNSVGDFIIEYVNSVMKAARSKKPSPAKK